MPGSAGRPRVHGRTAPPSRVRGMACVGCTQEPTASRERTGTWSLPFTSFPSGAALLDADSFFPPEPPLPPASAGSSATPSCPSSLGFSGADSAGASSGAGTACRRECAVARDAAATEMGAGPGLLLGYRRVASSSGGAPGKVLCLLICTSWGPVLPTFSWRRAKRCPHPQRSLFSSL